MKMRNKGKVHPFITSSSSSSAANKDAFSVLKLLPAAILALISVLSLEDREVLAYMITRSLKSANPSAAEEKKKNTKKRSFNGHKHIHPALFECECFDCYRSFWFRWDSSPNRELIHQAIEAFDEHLNNGERSKKAGNGKNKRREKIGLRKTEQMGGKLAVLDFPAAINGAFSPETGYSGVLLQESGLSGALLMESDLPLPEEVSLACVEEGFPEEEVVRVDGAGPAAATAVVVQGHKGLARKVLPDVLGLLNSRLWNLWNPNV